MPRRKKTFSVFDFKPARESTRNIQFSFTDKLGGLNIDLPPQDIADNQFQELLNVDIDFYNNTIQKRKGSKFIWDTGLIDKIEMFKIFRNISLRFLVLNTKKTINIYRVDGANLTLKKSISGVFTFVDYIQYRNKILILADKLNSYNMDTDTLTIDIKKSDNNTNVTGNIMAVHLNRVFIAQADGSLTKVVFSDLTDANGNIIDPDNSQAWNVLNYFEIDNNTEDPINALVSYRGNLIIFRQYSTYTLSGTSKENFSVLPLFSNVGIKTPNSHTILEGILYFISQTNEMMAYDGRNVEPVSKNKIEKILNESIMPKTPYKIMVDVAWGSDTYTEAVNGNKGLFFNYSEDYLELHLTPYVYGVDIPCGSAKTLLNFDTDARAIRYRATKDCAGAYDNTNTLSFPSNSKFLSTSMGDMNTMGKSGWSSSVDWYGYATSHYHSGNYRLLAWQQQEKRSGIITFLSMGWSNYIKGGGGARWWENAYMRLTFKNRDHGFVKIYEGIGNNGIYNVNDVLINCKSTPPTKVPFNSPFNNPTNGNGGRDNYGYRVSDVRMASLCMRLDGNENETASINPMFMKIYVELFKRYYTRSVTVNLIPGSSLGRVYFAQTLWHDVFYPNGASEQKIRIYARYNNGSEVEIFNGSNLSYVFNIDRVNEGDTITFRVEFSNPEAIPYMLLDYLKFEVFSDYPPVFPATTNFRTAFFLIRTKKEDKILGFRNGAFIEYSFPYETVPYMFSDIDNTLYLTDGRSIYALINENYVDEIQAQTLTISPITTIIKHKAIQKYRPINLRTLVILAKSPTNSILDVIVEDDKTKSSNFMKYQIPVEKEKDIDVIRSSFYCNELNITIKNDKLFENFTYYGLEGIIWIRPIRT